MYGPPDNALLMSKAGLWWRSKRVIAREVLTKAVPWYHSAILQGRLLSINWELRHLH